MRILSEFMYISFDGNQHRSVMIFQLSCNYFFLKFHLAGPCNNLSMTFQSCMHALTRATHLQRRTRTHLQDGLHTRQLAQICGTMAASEIHSLIFLPNLSRKQPSGLTDCSFLVQGGGWGDFAIKLSHILEKK